MPHTRIKKLTPVLPTMLALLAGASIGCAPQADPEYPGEPLLEVHGRIESVAAELGSDVVPKILFWEPKNHMMQFVPLTVEGVFPANFTLSAYSAPSPDALFNWNRDDPALDYAFPDEPEIAIGYIVATDPNPPQRARFAPTQERNVHCGTPPPCGEEPAPGDDQEVHCGEPEPCTVETSWCEPGRDVCYSEEMHCAGSKPDDLGQCELIHAEGDPALKEDSALVHGAIVDYLIVYLPNGAAAKTHTAYEFGAPEGIASGYQIMGFTSNEQVIDHDSEPCRQAGATALDQYNADPDNAVIDPNSRPHEQFDEKERLRALTMRAEYELGCGTSSFRAVDDLASQALTLQLSSDGLPFLNSN